MTWEVVFPGQMLAWIAELEPGNRDSLFTAIDLFRDFGPHLDRPYVGKIVGSKLTNMKELRPLSNSSGHLRVLFVFDPDRTAVLLVAGDKTGQWNKWYKKQIPIAEEIYRRYREQR
jgi:hypothetical protein